MNRDYFTSNGFKTVAYKTLIYGTAIFLLIIMQSTLFARLTLFGGIPDLALAATVTVTMKDSRAGIVLSIASGFLSCAIGGDGTYIYTLFSFFIACGVHLLSSRVLSVNYPSFLTYSALAFSAKTLFNIAQTVLKAESFDFASTLTHAIIPELLCSLIFCTPIYFAFGALTRIFVKKHLYKGDVR